MGALFSSPKAAPVRKMPDAQDPAATAAAEEARRKKMASAGRSSTDLSSGGGYGETILGS